MKGNEHKNHRTPTICDHWTKPQTGWLKLNVDAAINKENSCMGFGCVLRNDLGQFIAAKGAYWMGSFTSREAEAVAIRETLSWLKSHNFDNIHVETDSLQVVQGLNSTKGNLHSIWFLGILKNL